MGDREQITTSEIGTYLSCQRKHYLRYTLRLSSVTSSQALRFGTAWHSALECRWRGDDYQTALTTALTQAGDTVDAKDAAMLAGMLAGYYARYGQDDVTVRELYAEVPFRYPLKGSKSFDCAGKIDGLGIGHDGQYVLVEHKSAGEDIGENSDYWLRLRFNNQLFQYVSAARRSGWPITRIVYDVARKPAIKPLADKPTLDADGLKVVECAGVRVMKADGTPKQTATKDGEVVVSAPETMDEYAQRVADDCKARPEWYFARRDVPIMDADMQAFEDTRLATTKMILMQRALSRKCKSPEHAWPRNVNGMTCRSCEMSGLCLGGYALDADSFAACGLRVRDAKHEELATVTE